MVFKGGDSVRKLKFVVLVVLAAFLLPLSVSAHPGNTDENGGHYDQSTGEYHYHHGFPPHDHYDIDGDGIIDCPYDFVDKTGENSGSSYSSGNSWVLDDKPVSVTKEADKNGNLPPNTKEEEGAKGMGNLSVAIAILTLFSVAMVILAIKLGMKIKSEEEKIARKNTELKIAEEKCEKISHQYNSLLEVIQRKNKDIPLGSYSVLNPFSKGILDQLDLEIKIPEYVFFNKEGIPILLGPESRFPYGGYTVFSNYNSDVYHVNESCSGHDLASAHIFKMLEAGKRPCKKCGYSHRIPKTIPQWYLDIQEIQRSNDEK